MRKLNPKTTLFDRRKLIRGIMTVKLIVFIVCLMFVQTFAASYAQNVSLRFKNANLQKVLDEIQQQTGLELLYNNTLVNRANKKVTIDVTNVYYKNALKQVLAETNLTFEINNNTVVIKGSNASPKSNTNSSSSAAKQQSTVTGKVTDDQGAPLSGVTVTVKGTNVGTSTDNVGNYSLSLPAAAQVLVFSAMGYNSQELPINGQATVNATLVGQVDNLDEVVVVGYSTQRVRYLSSSVSTISAEKL